MNDHIFRKYDIRGVAERDLDDATVEKLGRAYGSHLVRRADDVGEGLRVGVGRDIRDSSNRLFDALETGLRRTGCHVVDLGVVPTPLVYFATHQLDLDGSVQITGSHNPAEYNGFKMMQGHAPLFGDDIQALKEAMIREDFVDAEPGGQWAHPELIDDYIEWVADDIDVGDYDVKVALDSGNGTAGVAAPKLVRAVFDTEPIELYSEPDGTFPNHHPDPTVEENLEDLRRVVREEDCDLGVAYDGDGDRIGVVDADGDIIWGDTLMILLARKVLAERPGATIIGEVKCSKTLFDDIEAHGGNAIMAAVGHSLIKDKIQETGAELAGEMSGHIFFNDRYFGFDDALYTTCRVMEIISQTGESVGELLDDVPETFATPELRRDCDEDLKFQIPGVVAEEFSERGHDVSTVDGARITFEHGWGLVRASNTQPKLVLRAEALSEEERDAYLEQLEDSVARAKRQIAQTSQG
jgi:phosphomannomutase/phosphoglucomutase